MSRALADLDGFAAGATFLLGHNLIAFDLPCLLAAAPNLKLLKLPVVDTLRLNPLAFPRNPYHHLVKHYQDGQLRRGRLNDPELDARLTIDLFQDQWRTFQTLRQSAPDLLAAWHWLTGTGEFAVGFNALFATLRQNPRPADSEARALIADYLSDKACLPASRKMLTAPDKPGWPLAYTLAWLSVAGGNSVLPPWVRHHFPETGELVRQLRDTACDDPDCPVSDH
ncbi:MAG: RecQ family ATP-dependent DNA helicase, partial [Desulfurivibrio sp.]